MLANEKDDELHGTFCERRHFCSHIDAAVNTAVDRSIKKTFAILGVDIDDPAEIENFRADLRFSKQLNKFVGHGQMAAVAAIFVALLAALWAGIVEKITGK